MELHVFKKIAAGLFTGFLALSFAQTSALAAESPEQRAETQESYREWAKEIPVHKNTVLIAVDEEYQNAHPDWMERTTNLVKEGTKDFKEYFNIEFVPVQYWNWKVEGDNTHQVMEGLKDQYKDYMVTKMDKNLNFNHVIAFTGKKSIAIDDESNAAGFATPTAFNYLTGSGTVKEKVISFMSQYMGMDTEQHTWDEIKNSFTNLPRAGFSVICDSDPTETQQSIENVVKHEVSHNYGVVDDKEGNNNSVMSYTWPDRNEGTPRTMDWASEEMIKIEEYMNKNIYKNREIEEVANINENLTFYKTGNLYFTQIKGSPIDEVGSYQDGYLQTDVDTDLKLGIDFLKHDLVQNVSERFNKAAIIGNELIFTPYAPEE